MPVLDLEVAADFVAARTGDTDRQAAAALAEAVGGPPLALEQAAAYAQATGSSLAAYLALFHKRRADLLDRGQLRSACTKAVIVATALVLGAVLTSVVRISVMSASLPGVREPILRERPALAALLVELA